MTSAAIRPIEASDAPALADLYVRNREFLQPFEPERPESFFTVEGQLERARTAAEDAAADRHRRYAILDDGTVCGTISLSVILRGPAQCGDVGYWVGHEHNGRGIATRAVAALIAEAFGPLGLHRLNAGVLTDNAASRRVLERNGFELIGLAPSYLRLNGAWRDHLLFQRLAD